MSSWKEEFYEPGTMDWMYTTLSYPIKHRFVLCSPILERIDLSQYLYGIEHVTVGGERSKEARICDFDWILDLQRQCIQAKKSFWFKQTGSRFRKDGVVYKVNSYKQHSMAKDFGMNL